MNKLALALAGILLAAAGPPQVAPPSIAPGTSVDSSTVAGRTLAARAGDVFNPRDYGAVGDGGSHTVSTSLGITTLAALAGYTSNGKAPYTFVNQYPFGTLFNLRPSAAASPGATQIAYRQTALVGVTIPSINASMSGSTVLSVSPYGGIVAGTPVSGPGIPAGDTVTGAFGGSITLASATTGVTPAKSNLVFSASTPSMAPTTYALLVQLAVAAPSGATTLKIASGIPVSAISVGASVTGIGIAGSTTVVSFDGSNLVINTPTTASIASANGTTVGIQAANVAGTPYLAAQYVPGMERIAAGTPVSGAGLPANETVQSVQVTARNVANVPTYVLMTLSAPTSTAASTYTPISIGTAFGLYVQDTTGVYPRMAISGAAIQTGTYVEAVNQATGEIRLSKPTLGLPIGGATLTFAWDEISTIAPGMQVSGPGIATGTTVSAVNTATGIVTLSASTTGNLLPVQPNWANPTQADGSPITFYAPFTNAQAASIQMDWLGIQAAEKAAEAAGHGTITIPDGRFQIDNPIVFPTMSQFVSTPPVIDVVGAGQWQTYLEAAKDSGLNGYILSCGDPSQDSLNGRGMYGNLFCNGNWNGLRLRPQSYGTQTGVRPTIGGVPIKMSGMLRGPRRHLNDLIVEGFYIGDDFQGDHTHRRGVSLTSNFIGWRLREPLPGLYGDLADDHVELYGNQWAGISVAPGAFLSGAFTKVDIAASPYGIWLEPGLPVQSSAIQFATFSQPNLEWNSCAVIKDGNIAPNFLGTGGLRGIVGLTVDTPFSNAGLDVQVTNLPGGCQPPFPGGSTSFTSAISPPSYFDTFLMLGFEIRNISQGAFPPITGGTSLLRTSYTNNYAFGASGGVRLSGPWMPALLDSYAAACQEIATGAGDSSSLIFWNAGSALGIQLETPGLWRGKVMPLLDTGATTLARGVVLEGKSGSGVFGAQRAGAAAAGTALVQGVVASAHSCSMVNRFIPVLAAGSELPVAVTATQALGTLLGADVGNIGKAASTNSTAPTSFLGEVTNTNNGSISQVFVRTPGW